MDGSELARITLVLAQLVACGDNLPDPDEAFEGQRQACSFEAGAMPKDTFGGLPAKVPIQHLIVLMQENRSFDHYLGHHPAVDRGEMDGIPATYVNPDATGTPHAPSRATTTCISPDLPHDWVSVHTAWNEGKVDGFFMQAAREHPGTGDHAIAYYAPEDLPFYTWLYGTFATSDRFFCATLGPTGPNRRYLLSATSNGIKGSGDPEVGPLRSIYDALGEAGISVGLYNPELYNTAHAPESAIHTLPDFFTDLASGSLPTVTFLNADFENSEHPPLDAIAGEQFIHDVVVAFAQSPAWSTSALIVTYDEAGGFFDHVAPPAACLPDALPENADFNRLGIRVPFVIVSPYSRPAFVSHRIHSHTSITRLIEVLGRLPALTNRDANSDALLDLFDFASPPSPPPDLASIPSAGSSTCP